MQLTCPTCHCQFPFEVALQHEAGRELASLLAGMPPDLSLPLFHYLGYFRPAKQQLGWGRALRLAREVMALHADQAVLAAGLIEAARSLDDKRAQPGWKPMGNHNYLTRCLESVAGRVEAAVATYAAQGNAPLGGRPAPRSKAGGALNALQEMKR